MPDIDKVVALLEDAIDELQGTTPPDPNPDPTPDPEYQYVRILRTPHANGFWNKDGAENGSGFPIIIIYPSEKQKDVPNRIHFKADRIMEVEKAIVRADGGKKFWKFPYLVQGLQLYLLSTDVTKVEVA